MHVMQPLEPQCREGETSGTSLQLIALPGIPAVREGDDLAALLADAWTRLGSAPAPTDILVVAQKIVSKAEGRLVALSDVVPSAAAVTLARRVGKDARLVELILAESVRVVRQAPGLLITEHRRGWIMANSGIDQSNLGCADHALLLPLDPDASAEALSARLGERLGTAPAVVINDSFGRPWRVGTVGVALGAAGLPSFLDRRGETDLFGRRLQATVIGYADEIAAAASLVMGQADEGLPAVLVRGLCWRHRPVPASALLRPAAEDLFR